MVKMTRFLIGDSDLPIGYYPKNVSEFAAESQ